jgi:DNA-binding PadR family transcriptional regulator
MTLQNGIFARLGNVFVIGDATLMIKTTYGHKEIKQIKEKGERSRKHITRLFAIEGNEFLGDEIVEGVKTKKIIKINDETIEILECKN